MSRLFGRERSHALPSLGLEQSKDGRQREKERGKGWEAENNGSRGSKRTMKAPQDHPPPPLLLRTNPPQRIISVPRHPNRGFKVTKRSQARMCWEKDTERWRRWRAYFRMMYVIAKISAIFGKRSFDPYLYSSNCEQRCILFSSRSFPFRSRGYISNRHIHKYIHIYTYIYISCTLH